MPATFYKHYDYAAVKRAFNSAWPNLRLELNHPGPGLDHDGRDEFDDKATFDDESNTGDTLLILSDQTNAGDAARMISERLGGQAFILRDYASVEEDETLEYCNDPFRLPLNAYTYGEFKQRFSERWTNLSIVLYDTSPDQGGLGENLREFADDFDMRSLDRVGDALHDHIFISDWGASLKRCCIAAAIKNNELGIDCDGNWRYQRLKAFQQAMKA